MLPPRNPRGRRIYRRSNEALPADRKAATLRAKTVWTFPAPWANCKALADFNQDRASRVEALAGQYQNGTYSVDSAATSRAMIADALSAGVKDLGLK